MYDDISPLRNSRGAPIYNQGGVGCGGGGGGDALYAKCAGDHVGAQKTTAD